MKYFCHIIKASRVTLANAMDSEISTIMQKKKIINYHHINYQHFSERKEL